MECLRVRESNDVASCVDVRNVSLKELVHFKSPTESAANPLLPNEADPHAWRHGINEASAVFLAALSSAKTQSPLGSEFAAVSPSFGSSRIGG